ncbi:bile acid:sodium symporter family protein [Saccharopolyspora sp. ASAGF58]|uniref:bile acid:sodium symporter family protein n=1 Tax=Saccharopolyspora sp. ASAGF58 TaxID=2719023 RepID=UPI00143FD6F7|nr:bile acid:sodium symporter family protein [Saccharopolyspora sp. ASAGF58]QIZ33789.1 bile acid:sodium symporter [Saccharopolyspora sp. ASAGF58]
MTRILARVRPDPYVVALLLVAMTAVLVPVRGEPALVLDQAVKLAIGFLFFLYGARLSTAAAWDGLRNWKLHGAALTTTFVLFPLLGMAASVLVPAVLPHSLYLGVLFLCLLPSTVQSAITFTSLAGGNVAAAICGSSFSNLLGVLFTPLLVGLLMTSGTGGFTVQGVRDIVLLLLVPFCIGQVLRPLAGEWIRRRAKVLGFLDRGVILAVVYLAFSEGTVSGVWQQLSPAGFGVLIVVGGALLAAALVGTALLARWFGFSRGDRIVLVFCGSNKSLASGLPMASVLFGSAELGLMVLPLMVYHQMQLIGCAWLARRFAKQAAEPVVVG